ncbi:MAG: hypothetical protein ACK4MF_01745 [Hyphomicrobiaceae bacterium]
MAADEMPSDSLNVPSRLPVWTGIGGFVLGAVFWHLVGFWSLVADVAFNKGSDKSPARLINLEEVAAVKAARAASQARQAAAQPAVVRGNDTAERHGTPDSLAELLQCSQARRGADGDITEVRACPPLSRRLPTHGAVAVRADREMDSREAAERLLKGWDTGVSRIETGSVQAAR